MHHARGSRPSSSVDKGSMEKSPKGKRKDKSSRRKAKREAQASMGGEKRLGTPRNVPCPAGHGWAQKLSKLPFPLSRRNRCSST